MAERILEVRDLKTIFKTERGEMPALDSVSFTVDEGEILALGGESGCGKSVTSKTILRLYDERRQARSEGEILLDGRNLLALPEKEMRKVRGGEIAMIFQDSLSSLNPVLSCGEQITETLRTHQKLSRREAREKAVELLRLVGIPGPGERMRQYPHELSGGMRQRVMIACALSCRPRLLIADEPTTALDVTIQAQIMDLIVALNRELNMGVILITHDLGLVAQNCSRVAVMYLGQIVEEAEVHELFRHPLHPYTRGLLKSIPSVQGGKRRALSMIEGAVPPLGQFPQGCRFCPRCPKAGPGCAAAMPELRDRGDGHKLRCFCAGEE